MGKLRASEKGAAMGLIVVIGIIWTIMSYAAGNAAFRRGRSWFGGFLLTFIIGPLGLAIVLLMPGQTDDNDEDYARQHERID
jgi:hypothetical protein